MAYEWIGAAIAGAGTAAAGFAGQHPSKNFRHAKELAAYNTALSEEMYNKYQSPAAQMAQYKEAGLNPYLMYNQQLTNTPEATPVEYDSEAFEPHPDKAIQGIANGIAQYQQIVGQQQALENAKQQADYIAAQTALVRGRVEQQNFENSKREEMYNLNKAITSTKLEQDALNLLIDTKLKEEKELAKLQNYLQDLENKKVKNEMDKTNITLLQEKINFVRENTRYLGKRIEYTQFSMDLANKKYDLDLRKFAADNYWKGQNYGLASKRYALDAYRTGLKVYQQGVSENQFKEKMAAARDAAGAALLFKIGQYLDKTGGAKFNGNLQVPQVPKSSPIWKALNPVGKPILL